MRLLVSLGLLVLVLSPRLVRANEDDDAARAHFLAGQSYYDQASYADALKEFVEAYRLSKRPALLYNIALCHERLDHFGEAAAALEKYLVEDPKTQDRALVEARIKNLRDHQQERERAMAPLPPIASPTPAVEPTTPPPPSPPRHRFYTWIVGGAGLALLGGAAAAGIYAHLKYQNLDKHCTSSPCTESYPGAQGDLDSGKNAAIVSDVLLAAGGAAVVTGVVLFFVEGRARLPPRAWLSPVVGVHTAGFALTLRR